MKYIDGQAIRSALRFSRWVDLIEEALLLEAGQDYMMPERSHVDFDNNTLLLMPCIAKKYFSTKIVNLYPDNPRAGKPALHGVVILNDRLDGKAIAVLDGPALTAMRTAAVGSFAVRHLSPPGAKRLGIAGLGIQGIYQAIFACSERDIHEVSIFDQNRTLYSNFIKSFNDEYPSIKIRIAGNSRELCENAEIIITATNSTTPVLPDDEELLRDRTIIGIGSYKEDMREFPDALYKIAGCIFLDSMHAIKESGDLILPLRKGLIKETDLLYAGEILKGNKQEGSPGVFKSVGSALFDLMGAVLVYETLNMS